MAYTLKEITSWELNRLYHLREITMEAGLDILGKFNGTLYPTILPDSAETLRNILTDCLKAENRIWFRGWELKIVRRLIRCLDKRGRGYFYHKLPESHDLWFHFLFITYKCPAGTRLWDMGPKRIRATLDAYDGALQQVFADRGKYCISYYHHGHWQVSSNYYPPFHGHSPVMCYRANQELLRWRKGGSWIKKWIEEPEFDRKLTMLPDLFGPPITPYLEMEDQLNEAYVANIRGVFGKRCVAKDEKLIHISRPVERKDAECIANYMTSNPARVLLRRRFSYESKTKKVKVWMRNSCTGPAEFPLIYFVQRFLVQPNKPFGKNVFRPKGGLIAASGLYKALVFIRDHAEAWPLFGWPMELSDEEPPDKDIVEDQQDGLDHYMED